MEFSPAALSAACIALVATRECAGLINITYCVNTTAADAGAYIAQRERYRTLDS